MTRKPTYDTLIFEFEEPVEVDEVVVGSDGTFQLKSGGKVLTPKQTTRSRHRDRATGREKVVFSLPAGTASSMLSEADVLASFPFVFTIDTNTVRIGGENVSVATIALSTVVRNHPGPGRATLKTVHPGGFEFHGLGMEQERLAWVWLQDAITGSPDFDPEARYLMITDHAKGKHAAINAREEPLFGEVFLAPNLTLGFATSDSGNSMFQQLIRSCDSLSTRFLNDVKSGQVGDAGLKTLSDAPITKLRGIMNNNPAGGWPSFVTKRFRLDPEAPMRRYGLS